MNTDKDMASQSLGAPSAQSTDGPVALRFEGETRERGFRIPYPAGMKPRTDRRFVDFNDTVRS